MEQGQERGRSGREAWQQGLLPYLSLFQGLTYAHICTSPSGIIPAGQMSPSLGEISSSLSFHAGYHGGPFSFTALLRGRLKLGR